MSLHIWYVSKYSSFIIVGVFTKSMYTFSNLSLSLANFYVYVTKQVPVVLHALSSGVCFLLVGLAGIYHSSLYFL